MRRKYHSPILLLSFFLFLTSCSNEYTVYHEQQQTLEAQKIAIEQNLASFSPIQIEAREVEILTTPDKKVLDRLITIINNAKKQVSVEVYILTEKRIIQALKDAKIRGVAVHVILEKNVFGATSINAKAFKALTDAGVGVTYANNKLYNFTHTKLLLADDIYVIATGNFSYASFTTNREWYVIGRDPKDFATLAIIFQKDFEKMPATEVSNNLVISPIDSRAKIESTLTSARSEILLYAETFGDPSIIDILAQKESKKIRVTICMADPKKIRANAESIAMLRSRGIDVRTSKKPTIHAKSFIVDDTYAYVGSENYTTNSLDNNREVGILLRANSAFVKQFRLAFYSDCPGVK